MLNPYVFLLPPHICVSMFVFIHVCVPSAVAAQLCPPKMLAGGPLTVIYKNVFDVMLHLEAEWPSKQHILIADTVLAESGP